MEPVALVTSPRYLAHRPPGGRDHVESPARLEAIHALLGRPRFRPLYEAVEPRAAEAAEVALVHARDHVERVLAFCGRGGGWLDGDTAAGPESGAVALLAAGGVLTAVDAVMSATARRAFALIRPPGHHAETSRAMGFCLFNNVAIAARYARARHGLERILILDWDVHHGNGTQWCFYDDPSVLYMSTHQFPLYPGTGRAEEVGEGQGAGYTLNVPLPPGCGDRAMLMAFDELLLPVARKFRPELILVSAGFDAHWADPLAQLRVTAYGYAAMASRLLGLAEETATGRLVLALEGGYHLQYLPQSVLAVLQVLAGAEVVPHAWDEHVEEADWTEAARVVERTRSAHQPYWG